MPTQRPDVFISATSADLKSIRSIIKDTLLDKDYFPVEQSHFAPDYRSVKEMLYEKLKKCHALIHVVGLRYGAEPQNREDFEPRRSYTQMEYHIAKELGLKIYTFICPDSFPFDENVKPESPELQELQKEHRQQFLNDDNLYVETHSKERIKEATLKLGLHLEKLRSEMQEGFDRVIDEMRKRDQVRPILNQLNKMLSQFATQFANIDKEQRFDMALAAVSTGVGIDPQTIRKDIDDFLNYVNDQENTAPIEDLYQAKMYEQKYNEAANLMEAAAAESIHSSITKLIFAGDAQVANLSFKEAGTNYNKALHILEVEHNDKLQFELFAKTGIVEFYLEKYNEAVEKLGKAFTYYTEHNAEAEKLGTFLFVAAGAKVSALHKQGFTMRALTWASNYNLGEKLFKVMNTKNKSEYLCADLYKKLADVYSSGDKIEEAIEYYEKLIDWIERNSNKPPFWLALQSESVYRKGKIYENTDNISFALECYNQALSISDQGLRTEPKHTELIFQKTWCLYCKAGLYFRRLDKINGAEQLYNIAYNQCFDLLVSNSDEFRFIRVKSCCMNGMADVHSHKDRPDLALKLYSENLTNSRRILDDYGQTAERLRDVAFDATRKADVLYYNKDDIDGALELYEESFVLSRRILDDYGQTAERLRNVAFDATRKADVLYESKDDVDGALELYEESLVLSRRILDDYGQTADRLRNVAIGAARKADVLYKSKDDVDGALELYEESLILSRRILDNYGQTAERLRDVAIGAARKADVLYKSKDDINEALELYEESLVLSRRILDDYGQTAERLRDVASDVTRKADVLYKSKDDVDGALELYEESLILSRRILSDYERTIQRLIDVSFDTRKIAEIIKTHKNNIDTAFALFVESMQMRFEVLKHYGANSNRYDEISKDMLEMFNNDGKYIGTNTNVLNQSCEVLKEAVEFLKVNREEKTSDAYENYNDLLEVAEIFIGINLK